MLLKIFFGRNTPAPKQAGPLKNWWRELESNQLRNIAVNIPAEYIRRLAGIPSVNLVSVWELNPLKLDPLDA